MGHKFYFFVAERPQQAVFNKPMCEEQKMSSNRLRCLSVTQNFLLIDSFPRSPQDSYLRVWSSQIACLSFVPESTATQSIPLTWGVRVFKAATSCGQNDRTYLSDGKKNTAKHLFNCRGNTKHHIPKKHKLGGGNGPLYQDVSKKTFIIFHLPTLVLFRGTSFGKTN